MRTILCATSYWHDKDDFDAKYEGRWITERDPLTNNRLHAQAPEYKGLFGLKRWYDRVQYWFAPDKVVLACGTWSEPGLSRFGGLVHIVNAGAYPDHVDDDHWNYSACAWTALFAYLADHRNDWDLMIYLSTDVLVGGYDWNAIYHEFMQRPEIVFGPGWCGRASDFFGWKPPAIIRYLHQKRRPNLCENPDTIIEDDLDRLFHDPKLWWNPFPDTPNIRQDYGWDQGCAKYNEEMIRWPTVRLPHPDVVEKYQANAREKGVPFRKNQVPHIESNASSQLLVGS